jgi:hypothetical protein
LCLLLLQRRQVIAIELTNNPGGLDLLDYWLYFYPSKLAN